MLNYFCSKCGGKNLYQFQKPKFCSHCGTSFTIDASAINTIKSNKFEVNIDSTKNINNRQADFRNYVEEDDDNNFIGSYSSMRGLDVHIEKGNQNNGIKLGDLVSDEPKESAAVKVNKKIPKRRGRKKLTKSLPESFVSEAKMTGRNYQDNDDIIQNIE
jgi:uncharacterized Zn finger protein (UPF0148 family)